MEQSNIDQNIIIALEKISQINRLLLWDIWKDERLSPLQISFIEYIANSSPQLATVSHIAQEFSLKKSTVSDSLTALIKKGILHKEIDVQDQRIHYFLLTKNGQEKINLIKKHKNYMIEKISSIPEEQKVIVCLFLMDVIKNFYDEGIIQTAKMCITCKNFIRDESEVNLYYCQFTRLYFNNKTLKFNCSGYTLSDSKFDNK